MSDPEVLALARTLRHLGVQITMDGGDPTATQSAAVAYQLAAGWDCEGTCELPDDPNHVCTGALDGIAVAYGWPGRFVRKLRDARYGQRILLKVADG